MTASTQTWQPAVARMQRAWHGSPLPGFFAWWGRELRACLPARMAAWFERHASWYLLALEADEVTLRAAGSEHVRARIDTTQAEALQQTAWRDALSGADPQDVRLALCLPANKVLRRQLYLPAAARADLRRVVGYDMDRQTPFRVGDVCFDVRPLGIAADGRLKVELVLTPRRELEPLLQRLAIMGARVDAVDVADGDGRLGVNLLDAAARPSHPHPRRRLNLVLAGLVIVLLALIMGQWLHNRRSTLAAMQAQVEALHGRARQVTALRNQLVQRLGATGFLIRQRAQSPAMIDVLADVTHRLPDATWLERLSVDATGHVALQGQSPHATQLLKRMAGSAYLGDPGFQGVIQTDARTGKERFFMTAQLHAPTAASAPASAASVASTGEGADAQADRR